MSTKGSQFKTSSSRFTLTEIPLVTKLKVWRQVLCVKLNLHVCRNTDIKPSTNLCSAR